MQRRSNPEQPKFDRPAFRVMSDKSTNPRWLALKAVLLVVQRGRSLDDGLQVVLKDLSKVDERDVSLCRALAYGICRWYFGLQAVVDGYLRKPFKKKDKDIDIVLLLGLYQIAVMKIDHHAAVNETVKLTQWLNKGWAKGLVNAVLRSLIRDQISLDRDFDEVSYPDWIRQAITQDWPQQAATIMAAGNQRAPMTLRLDLAQQSITEYLEELQKTGITASAHDQVESALVLDKPRDVTSLPGFKAGRVSVQDAATQLAAGLLDCQPGMRVLDACAAPGGKSAHLLQATPDIQLTALDQDKTRLKLVEDNLQRIGHSAQLICGDAASPIDWHDGKPFDRILADVPCSASGVIRRHPDIKLLRRASDIKGLVVQQRQILMALWTLLKPGGLLLYSTCSIFKDENERQIDWFVQNIDNGTVIGPNSVQWGEQRPWGRQILPGTENMDGFYYACLQKTGTGDRSSS